MSSRETTYVLGAGAIGLPLAAYLADSGRAVVAVRTSRDDVPEAAVTVTVHGVSGQTSAQVRTVSLARLERLEGVLMVTAKAHANAAIAAALRAKGASGPVVILQNGIGVEQPFLEAGFPQVYRCVLYITGQAVGEQEFKVRPINPSPVGVVRGDAGGLEACVAGLSTPGFPLRAAPNIQREVWKKAVINAVFNSVCPLLEVDNGVFARDGRAAELAGEIVRECVSVTDRLGLGLGEPELMEQLLRISKGSDGQLISTLQDIRAGRPTEIESLNLEIARVAAALEPPLHLPRTEFLGKMILAKSEQHRSQS